MADEKGGGSLASSIKEPLAIPGRVIGTILKFIVYVIVIAVTAYLLYWGGTFAYYSYQTGSLSAALTQFEASIENTPIGKILVLFSPQKETI